MLSQASRSRFASTKLIIDIWEHTSSQVTPGGNHFIDMINVSIQGYILDNYHEMIIEFGLDSSRLGVYIQFVEELTRKAYA
jgi:hypothetical protein